MSKINVMHVSIGLPSTMKYYKDQEIRTGICKKTVDKVFLSKEGFQGDGVANTKFHGGPDRAVCVYPYEHYSLWEQEFGVKLPHTAFGENITVTNMTEAEVCIGDIFQLGDAVIQVTQGRIPCDTISKRVNIPSILSRIIEEGYTGYFCRVLTEGMVQQDSKVTLLQRHPKQVSVLYANKIYFHSPTDSVGIQTILEIEELANVWQQKLTARLEKLR